ncbi:MAG: DUF7619 domain-containing protein [bacterium JZ-2024 1]
MRKLLHFEMFVVFLVAILLLAVPGNPAYAGWARLYGDSTAQEIHDSVQTPDGGYLMVGATKLGAPPYSALIIKLDSSGQLVWARSYGSNNEVFNSIIPLPNGNYLVAGKTKYFDTDDCLIVEVDSSGNVLTVRTFRGAGWDTCDAVARTPDGNFILAGSSLFFSPWNQDALLLKVNPSYDLIWSKLYSNPPVGGSYGMEELYALVPTGESGAIAVGSTDHSTAHDPSDVLALRVDVNGNLLWNSVFNGFYQDDEVWDEAKDVIFLADGSVMLTGYAYMNTSYDLLLLQLDAGNGAPLFNATYGDASANEYGQSLVETPSGELVITGWVSDATGARALFTRLDANRNVTIANVLGPATNADEITANILDVASYFVSGYSYGYVPDGEAMGIKINDGLTIPGCADISTVTLPRGQQVSQRTITLVTTDYSLTPNSYSLNSTTLDFITRTVCTGEVVGPDITVWPTSHNYGTLTVGQQADKVFQVWNDGNADLHIGVVTDPLAPFSKIADTCSNQTLAPAQTCEITYRFQPTSEGTFTGNSTIPSDDPDEPSVVVNLSGNGVAPDIEVSPDPVDFGGVHEGRSYAVSITVRNSGNGNLIIGTISAPTGPFHTVEDYCSSKTLESSGICYLRIEFTPPPSPPFSGGVHTGSLSIPSNDPDENPYVLPLRGVEVSPPVLIAPANDVYVSESPQLRLRADAPGVSTLHFTIEIGREPYYWYWTPYDQRTAPTGWSKPSYSSGEEGQYDLQVRLAPGDYKWRANVHYEGISSEYSEVRSFRVPEPPTLLSPEYGATVGSHPIFTMTWNNPGTPTTLHYILEILDSSSGNVLRTYDQRESSNGWSKPSYAPGETASFQVPDSLPQSENGYSWRARIFLDDFGAMSPASPLKFFSVKLPTINEVSPTPIVNSAKRVLDISGNGFIPGTTVKLVCTACPDDSPREIPATILVNYGYYMQVEFDLTSSAIFGGYDLVITNPLGDEERLHLLIQPFISFPWMESLGPNGIPILPETWKFDGTRFNNFLVYNFTNSRDPGFFLVEFDLTGLQEFIRVRVGRGNDEGTYDRRQALNKNKATVLIPVTSSATANLPLGLGVNPEKVIFPSSSPAGFSPSNDEEDFVIFRDGKQVTWKGIGSATKDTVKGMIVDTLISAGCGIATDLLLNDPEYRNLKKAVSDVVDSLPDNVAKTPEYVIKQVASALAGLIPGVPWVTKFTECMDRIVGGFINAFDSAAKRAADRLRAQNEGDILEAQLDALEEAQRRGGNTLYAYLAYNIVSAKLHEPPCSPAPSNTGGGTYTVQAPWDPNDKLTITTYPCERVDVNGVPQCARYFIPMANATDPIEYMIRFENKAEATAPAVNVVITDVLDPDLDPSTLNVINSSHPHVFQTPEVNGQTVIFRFTDINLPPNTNPPEGEGFVRFTVKPRPGLPPGTEIRNKASIVFDFNPPIETPEVVHILGTGEVSVTRGTAQLPTTAQKGATNVPLLQFRITSGPSEGIKIEGFTLQASGTGNDQTDILAVRLFLDANSDGTVGQNDIELWRGNFSADNGTATISIPPRTIPPNASETYLVTYDFAQTIAFQGIQHMPRFARLQHENKSQPIPLSRYPLFPFALCLILAIFSTGNKRFHALFSFLLLLSTFWFLTSCGGGRGPAPAETRSYRATLTSITAKGAITNTNVSVTGTPISGPTLSVQK